MQRRRRHSFGRNLRKYQGGWAQFIYFVVVLILSIVLAPKPPKPRAAALDDFDVPVAEEDRPIPVLFGTWRITGANVLWYGDLMVSKITKSSLFSTQTIGFKYHLGMHMGFCHGPVDEVSRIEWGDKLAWEGSVTENDEIFIDNAGLFGGAKREGGLLVNLAVCMGAADQAVDPYLHSKQPGPTPAYRGTFCIISKRFIAEKTGAGLRGLLRKVFVGYVGTTPYVKAVAVTATRILAGWKTDVWYPEKAIVTTSVGTGMNPMHIIYQCLSDPEWGMGEDPLEVINDANFRAMADQLFDEGFGLNMLWNQQTTIEEFVGIVLDHIAGMLAFDHTTGRYEVKLVRGDYDPTTLPIFDESNLDSIDRFDRRSWGETVNDLTLSYTNAETGKGTAIIVQDLGNIASQQRRIPEKADFSGINDPVLMRVVAGRELGARSTPLARLEAQATRAFWQYGPGDVIRIRWAAHKLGLTVFRVLGVKGGTLQSGVISVHCVEDIYALPGIEYSEQEPTPTPEDGPDTPEDSVDQAGAVIATLSSPPTTGIMSGDRYLVGPGATGVWAGHEGQIAEADVDEDQWNFTLVNPGALIYDQNEGSHVTVDEYGNSVPAPWTPAIPTMQQLEDTHPDLSTLLLATWDDVLQAYRYVTADQVGGGGGADLVDEDADPDEVIEAPEVLFIKGAQVDDMGTGGVRLIVSPNTSKGDLATRSSTAHVRQAAGADGTFLSYDSTTSTGLRALRPPAGAPASGARVHRTSNQTIVASTLTAVAWQSEDFDTDGFWTVGAASRFTIPTDGKYLIGANVLWDANTANARAVYVVKNGTTSTRLAGVQDLDAVASQTQHVTALLDLVATDYVEIYVYQGEGAATRDVVATEQLTSAWIAKVGAITVPRLIRGATWVRGSGTILVPVNDVMLHFPKACRIVGVSLFTIGGVGNCVVDIWKDTYANFPPTIADTITAAAKPTISAGVKYQDTTLTGWTTTVNAGDVMLFHLESNTNFSGIFVTLHVEETS